jgi:hypothetical protein
MGPTAGLSAASSGTGNPHRSSNPVKAHPIVSFAYILHCWKSQGIGMPFQLGVGADF